MLLRAVGNSLLLNYEFLVDLYKSIENIDKKVKMLYFNSDGKSFSVYTSSSIASVIGGVQIEGLSTFGFGLDAARFVALVKKLHGQSDIRMTLLKNAVLIQQDNISAKFPTSILIQHSGVPNFEVMDTELAKWMSRQVAQCSKIIPNSRRYPGILIDNDYRNITRLIQFGDNAFRVAAFPKVSLAHSRILIPPEISQAIRSLSDRVQSFLYRKDHFGVVLESGLYFYMPTLVDSHPSEYGSYLHLEDSVAQLAPSRETFVFDKQQLVVTLEMISSVMREEETLVRFDFVGMSSSKLPVWKISAQSVTGFDLSENLECVDGNESELPSFRINRKIFLNTVKECDGNPVLRDMDNMFALSDGKERCGVTMLMKDLI